MPTNMPAAPWAYITYIITYIAYIITYVAYLITYITYNRAYITSIFLDTCRHIPPWTIETHEQWTWCTNCDTWTVQQDNLCNLHCSLRVIHFIYVFCVSYIAYHSLRVIHCVSYIACHTRVVDQCLKFDHRKEGFIVIWEPKYFIIWHGKKFHQILGVDAVHMKILHQITSNIASKMTSNPWCWCSLRENIASTFEGSRIFCRRTCSSP